MRGWLRVGFFLAVTGWGCSGPIQRTDPDRTLPFTVKLKEIKPPDPTEAQLENALTPALFDDPRELTRKLARSLGETGVFTRVLLHGDAGTAADLELEITFNNYDFGAGQPTFGGATFSTLAWIFVGPASWLIDNREYLDSRVSMQVVFRDAAQTSADSTARLEGHLFQDDLTLQGLQLSFLERSEPSDWFWNIFIPPWVGDGDRATAGRSLVERCERFFADNEPPRMLARFPADYIGRTACFLGYNSEKAELVIVSREPVGRVRIHGESSAPREIDQVELLGLAAQGSEKDALRNWLRERVVGLGNLQTDRYYGMPLEDGEVGFVRVQAELEGGGPLARWTVYRTRSRAASR